MAQAAVVAYVAGQVGTHARRTAGRKVSAVLVVLFLAPIMLMVLVAGVSATLSSRDGTGTGGVDCQGGGASPGTRVTATWNGRPYRDDQVRNAQTIVSVGRAKSVPAYGWVVAIAAAMQESTLTNVDYGDRDSLGLFQMRPSMGWGTSAQLTDPVYASGKFYDVLLAVPGWQSMTVTQAAQAVERSGFPDAYAQHETAARALVQDPVILGADCTPADVPGTEIQQRAVAAAMSQLGVPYSWGGGDWNGPTYGIEQGAGTLGFDCSGLTGYAWYQGSGGKVAMDTFTGSQEAATVAVSKADIQAGDLFHFPGHVGMYDGRGGMIHAPHTGTVIQVTPNILSNSYWMGRLTKIGRPKAYLAIVKAGGGTPSSSASIAAMGGTYRPPIPR